ncbi:MAG: beta-lactamase family protein [Bacteroidales bacterium]|jgi:CubicO group peptidase (beta-lactamase class C family)|nr:beta-lactamase family protein [Bacteroidales bacterium]
MKTRTAVLSGVLVLVLGAGVVTLNAFLPVVTGYAAKNLASGVFVAGRTQEDMENTDLNFSFIKYTHNTVNYEHKFVKSRLLWNTSKAVFIAPDFGCTLLAGYPEDSIRSRKWPQVVAVPQNPDTVPWPTGDLLPDTVPQGIDLVRLKAAVEWAMADTVPMKGTFALIVLYKGVPVAEAYSHNVNADTRFLSWSMAKSVSAILAGCRVADGRFDVNVPLAFPQWTDARARITADNLLRMNSGLKWTEDYGTLSDVTAMLHKEPDMGGYTLRRLYESAPGARWEYATGSTNLLCYALRRSFNSDIEYWRYPRMALFNRIGMRSAVFETDASGTFSGGSYLYATARDYARFGLLCLNAGWWNGVRLLPEQWFDYITTPTPDSGNKYGASFWLNRAAELPAAPPDMFWCDGHDGQYIFVIPSLKLVVVRTGFSKKGDFSANLLLREIVNSITER